MDFVSDVRRFAAGLELKDAIKGMPIKLNHKIDFYQHGGRDQRAESFLREWLEDVASADEMGENVAELRYPPSFENKRIVLRIKRKILYQCAEKTAVSGWKANHANQNKVVKTASSPSPSSKDA